MCLLLTFVIRVCVRVNALVFVVCALLCNVVETKSMLYECVDFDFLVRVVN